jgi:hypothetical protein
MSGIEQRRQTAAIQDGIGSIGALAEDGAPPSAPAPGFPAQRHQDLIRQGHRTRAHIGGDHGLAGHIHAWDQVWACQTGVGIAPVQDRVGLGRLDDASGKSRIRSQEQRHDHGGAYEIILRMLHCNTSKYVVDRRHEARYQTNP